MPILGAGVVVLIAIIMSTSVTKSAPVPETLVTAVAGQKIERTDFTFKPLPRSEAVIAPTEPVQVIVAAPVPRPKIERTVEIQAPPSVPAPAPIPEATVPAVDPAVAACLGKFVGTQCTFTKDAATKDGTCMTIAWSPVTCVTHTP